MSSVFAIMLFCPRANKGIRWFFVFIVKYGFEYKFRSFETKPEATVSLNSFTNLANNRESNRNRGMVCHAIYLREQFSL